MSGDQRFSPNLSRLTPLSWRKTAIVPYRPSGWVYRLYVYVECILQWLWRLLDEKNPQDQRKMSITRANAANWASSCSAPLSAGPCFVAYFVITIRVKALGTTIVSGISVSWICDSFFGFLPNHYNIFILYVWQVVASYITKQKTVLEPIRTTASSLVFLYLWLAH